MIVVEAPRPERRTGIGEDKMASVLADADEFRPGFRRRSLGLPKRQCRHRERNVDEDLQP